MQYSLKHKASLKHIASTHTLQVSSDLFRSRRFELVTCRFELRTCGFELVPCGFELVTRGLELALLNFNSCF